MWVKHSQWIRREKGRIADAMRAIAREEASNLQRTIDTPYPPASEPGTPPHLRTGTLRASVDANVTEASGTRVALTFHARAPYATFLEFGTERTAPRPFMRPHRTRFSQRFIPKLRAKLAAQQ